ncbi:MAG: hypothetical protein JNN01_12750, partial [Opitutaceae bacterium]|nr:hypothetical protein [Opitutaceae bacterium]
MNRRAFLAQTGALAATASLGPRTAAAAPAIPSAAARPEASAARDPNAAPALAPRFGDGRDWWFQKRFGMFLHWGLYSIE